MSKVVSTRTRTTKDWMGNPIVTTTIKYDNGKIIRKVKSSMGVTYTRRIDAVYGVRGPNNLTFEKSVNDPHSNLRRMGAYIEHHGPTSKRDLIQFVFNRNPNSRDSWSGWSGTFFRFAVKAGFFTKTRSGRTVLWGIGQTYTDLITNPPKKLLILSNDE